MKNLKFTFLFLFLCSIIACKNKEKESEKSIPEIQKVVPVNTKISIEPLTDSPEYADAKLALNTPKIMTIDGTSEFDFDFKLENYVLGNQTNSSNAEKLANSGKGQHIHFILDNKPYSAHYESNIKKQIPKGVHHLVAFISRSYHESVKNDSSVVYKKLMVGKNPVDTLGIDIDAPTLIYSRPKGTYVGKDTKQILLDFFILNTKLSETGNKVIASINGEEFVITKWEPYLIKGLPMGEVTIQLKLVDAKGNIISGPFNEVNRKIVLKENNK